jgi:hypothetical protein
MSGRLGLVCAAGQRQLWRRVRRRASVQRKRYAQSALRLSGEMTPRQRKAGVVGVIGLPAFSSSSARGNQRERFILWSRRVETWKTR